MAAAVDLRTARRNAVLGALGPDDLTALAAHLRAVPLERGTVLYEADEPVPAVYFPLEGVVSVVARMRTGEAVEVATIGCEGVVGIAVFLGPNPPTERALVQVTGHGLVMTADDFRQAATDLDGPLHAVLRRYVQSLFTQLARNGACNHIHPVRQRAARWLLMTADRMGRPSFDLTQEFLSQMLAVRRATVSEVAQELAEAGCISYTAGRSPSWTVPDCALRRASATTSSATPPRCPARTDARSLTARVEEPVPV